MGFLKELELANKRAWTQLLRRSFRNEPHPDPVDPAGVRKILILRLDRLGDLIVSTPLFRSLSHHLPHARIGVFGGPQNADIVAQDPRVTWVYRRTRHPLHLLAEALRARRECFDVLLNLNLNPSLTGSIIANVAAPRAVKVMGSEQPSVRSFYNKVLGIERDLETPMVDHVLRFLEVFGISPAGEDRRSYLPLGGVPTEKVERFLEREGLEPGGFIIINPFAGAAHRHLGRPLAREVAARMREETGLPVVILWAPGQDAALGRMSRGFIAGPDGCSILETALLIGRARLVISPDTSIVHIADAVGRPVVVIYSAVNPSYREWFPRGAPYRAIETDGVVGELRAEMIVGPALELLGEMR